MKKIFNYATDPVDIEKKGMRGGDFMDIRGVRKIITGSTKAVSELRPLHRYEPKEDRRSFEEEKEFQEDKRKKNAEKPAAVREDSRGVPPATYSSHQMRLNSFRMADRITEYDFSKTENIATICFNFILSLRLSHKSFLDRTDPVIEQRRESFFREFGEILLDRACRKVENEDGGFCGMDEIISVKEEIWKKLNDYLSEADVLLDDLIERFPREWRKLVLEASSEYGKELGEFRVICIRENFFTAALREELLVNGNHPSEEEILLKAASFFPEVRE